MVITSKENEIIKHAIKLREKKHRMVFNQFFVEGERLVFDAFKNEVNFKYILIEQGKSQHYLQLLDCTDAKIYIVSSEISKYISQTVHKQGIFAILEQKSMQLEKNEKVLILDRIQDPGNMGTLLRTAAATNFKNVLLINCVDIYNDKVLRSTMGGIFRVNAVQGSIEDISRLKALNYLIFKADMKGENIFKINIESSKIALVIGNEGNGVDKEISNLCTNSLSIPMLNGVESLNAGVSGSIIMYYLSKGEF